MFEEDRNNSPFQKLANIFEKFGIILTNEENSNHMLIKEPSIIIKQLQSSLENNSANDLLELLKQNLKDDHFFQTLLNYTNLQKTSSQEYVTAQSIIRILLNTKTLQDQMVDILLDKLGDKICDEKTEFLLPILESFHFLSCPNKEDSITKTLVEILECADFAIQSEILDNLPNIITGKQCNKVTERLMKLLDENENLVGPLVKCFSSFHLTEENKESIVRFILDQCLVVNTFQKQFPILFQFLVMNCKDIQSAMQKCFQVIDSIMSSDKRAVKIESANIIKNLVDTNGNLYNAIMSHQSKHPKAVHFFLLLVLYEANNLKQKQIENLIRKRIRTHYYKPEVIESFFKTYLEEEILNTYYETIIEVAGHLVQTQSDPVLCEIGVLMIRKLFGHSSCDRPKRYNIINQIVYLVVHYSHTKNAVLKLLKQLCIDCQERMLEHGSRLMQLTNSLDIFNLINTKLLFEVLCIVCINTSTYYDQLHMTINKLLLRGKDTDGKKGIMGAVVMFAYLSSSEDEECFQKAQTLLNFTKNLCCNNASLLGLLYDELATSITEKTTSQIIDWLFDDIVDEFQNDYIVTRQPMDNGCVPLKALFELNTSNEVDENVYLNIAEFVIDFNFHTRIKVLCPLFRLMRNLNHYKNHGEIGSIDALLGCGIIMPEMENIDGLSMDQLEIVANSIFHCINWFREVISAFVTPKINKLRIKVLNRIKHVISLQEKLDYCMSLIPDHKLPLSYFNNDSEDGKADKLNPPPAKRQKTDNTTAISVISAALKSTSANSGSNLSYTFREIDTDVLLLLKYPVSTATGITESQMKMLHTKQFQFILKDFIYKLKIILFKVENSPSELLNTISPEDLICDTNKLLPYVNVQFKQLVENIADLLETNDNCLDSPNMNTDEAKDLKLSFDLVLELYKLVFSWEGFQVEGNTSLLKQCFKSFACDNESLTFTTIQMLAIDLIKTMAGHSEHCLLLSSAVNLVQLMQSIRNLKCNGSEADNIIVKTTKSLLNVRWLALDGNAESGKSSWEKMYVLLMAYLENANVASLNALVKTLLEEAPQLVSKEDSLKMLPSVDKQNVHVFYKSLCETLVIKIKKEIQGQTNTEHIKMWKNVGSTMDQLIEIAKTLKSKSNLRCFTKKSLQIIRLFMSHGIPIMEIMLRSKPDDVKAVLKTLQKTTRFLHRLCCDSLHNKDSSIIALVPQIRQVLEKQIYDVKSILVANNCSEAFWMGTLKNRDIDGQSIASQTGSVDTTTNENEENDESDDSTVGTINVPQSQALRERNQ